MAPLTVFLVVVTAQCAVAARTIPSYHLHNYHSAALTNKNCNSLTNCLDYAMSVIHVSERYSLFESLWFDAINGTNHSYIITTSDPKNFTELVKKASQLFDTHYLIWKIAPGLNVKVFKKNEDKFAMTVVKDIYPVKQDGRTFGIGKRRIMMALLPIMYKLGVITTLLVALTVITLKSLTIGVILLMLSFGGLVSKLKHSHYPAESYHAPKKDIHIHVHPFPAGKPQHYIHNGYSSWHRDGDELHDDVTTGYEPTSSPTTPWSYLPPFMTY